MQKQFKWDVIAEKENDVRKYLDEAEIVVYPLEYINIIKHLLRRSLDEVAVSLLTDERC